MAAAETDPLAEGVSIRVHRIQSGYQCCGVGWSVNTAEDVAG